MVQIVRKPRARKLLGDNWIVFGDGTKGHGTTLECAWYSWILTRGVV